MAHDQDLAAAYELIYVLAAGKDYEKEAHDIAALVRQRHSTADSLLDVACGTGLHLSYLRNLFARVEGLELSNPMLAAATALLDGVAVHPGDMRDFHLGRTFGAVTCLFSSIGYARSVRELNETLSCLAAHLEPGGVLVLEPWFTPDQWTPGSVHPGVARDSDRHVARMCYSEQSGTTSTMTMHYLFGETGAGVRHWTEEHIMTLFTVDEYDHAVRQAGLSGLERLPGWHDDRPRMTAVKR